MAASESETIEAERSGRYRVVAIACAVLALVPFVALCIKVYNFGLYFPYWDAWHFSLFLQKAGGEGIGFGDLWAQHNEHRIVFPRLIMYVLAMASGWNVAWELVTSILLGLASYFVLCRMAFRGFALAAGPWWVVPFFSLLVFSWVQMENWIWGWQMQVFLSTTAVVTGAWALTGPSLNPLRFAVALCLGVVASFSFANGQLYWFAMAPVVVLAPKLTRESRLIYSLLWVAAGVLVVQLYLLDYAKPSVSPSMDSVLHAPLQVVGYIIVYVGAPVTGMFTRPAWHGVDLPIGPGHFIAGTLGLVALPVLVAVVLRRNKEDYPALLPWVGLALYVLGSAAITAAGRAALGLEQAMTSRYTTIGTLYWCALAGVVVVYLRGRTSPLVAAPRTRGLLGALGAACLLGALLLSQQSQRDWEQNAHWKRMGWNGIRAGHLSPLYLQDLCWDPVELRDRFLPILREGHWAGLGGAPYKPVDMAGAYVEDAEQFMKTGLLAQAKVYLETALMLDEGNERARARYGELRSIGEGRK